MSDFDKNLCTYRPNFLLLPRKILLKLDHFEASYHRSKLSDFDKILRGNTWKEFLKSPIEGAEYANFSKITTLFQEREIQICSLFKRDQRM